MSQTGLWFLERGARAAWGERSDWADSTGRVAVVFVDETDDETGLAELEGRRDAGEQVGVLVVSSEHQPLENLAARLSGMAWDVARSDSSIADWRVRIERLGAQMATLRELETLRFQATHDDRTGLLRPSVFQHRLEEHFAATRRHGHPLTLVMLDLDRFGAINKTFDHTVGDDVIKRVGDVIRGHLRAEDVAGRLGGDEFALLLPFTDEVQAAQLIARLAAAIRGLSGPLGGTERQVSVSASIGSQSFDGCSTSTVQVLRSHAERALRCAKRAGGDRALSYSDLREPVLDDCVSVGLASS